MKITFEHLHNIITSSLKNNEKDIYEVPGITLDITKNGDEHILKFIQMNSGIGEETLQYAAWVYFYNKNINNTEGMNIRIVNDVK